MFAGHFALAAGTKLRPNKVPLWALMLATQFLDIVFIPLYLTGVETLQPLGKGGYGGSVIHADYSHSLLGALLLSIVAMALGRFLWNRKGGLIIGAIVFSHWILDLLVHHADLPLLPGNFGGFLTLGLSLWRFPILSAGLELAMIIAGTALYGVSLWREAGKAKPTAVIVATSFMGIFLTAALASDFLSLG
jgi:hypothetical protein